MIVPVVMSRDALAPSKQSKRTRIVTRKNCGCTNIYMINGVLVCMIIVVSMLNFVVHNNHDHVRGSPQSMIDHFISSSLTSRVIGKRDDEAKTTQINHNVTTKEKVSRKTVVKQHKPASVLHVEEAPLEKDGIRYHLVFSTDCSEFQHWQSYLLFHSALKVGQPGRVTRIASGCNEEQSAATTEWHNVHVKGGLSDRFGLHLTPKFSSVRSEDGSRSKEYKFFNKPFGLLHWLEHGEWIRNDGVLDEDVVVILIDPDMVLLRPIINDFSDGRESMLIESEKLGKKYRVEHGTPFAQLYGMGTSWKNRNITAIAGASSPALRTSYTEAKLNFPAGPPYIATARDMFRIATKWVEFAPLVHAEHPFLMAEMYAYCIAAAHVELPHQITKSMMVSSITAAEAWDFIAAIPDEDICEHGRHPNHTEHAIPTLMHYCQRYGIDTWFFGKRRMPKNFFTCESPLLAEPPADVAVTFDYWTPPPPHRPVGEKKMLHGPMKKRSVYMVCGLITALNEAAEYFKMKHCEGVKNTRMDKSMELKSV